MALAKDIQIGRKVRTRDGREGRIVRGASTPPRGFAFIEFEGAPLLVSISTFEVKA
jgi:hypothetical protein